MRMQRSSSQVAARKPEAQSRVSNGTATFLDGVDGRSALARRFRDVLGQIVADLGGSALMSEGQRQLARRAATISVECERLEAQAMSGADIDLDAYGQMTDRLGRAFTRLGLKRVMKPVPDLQSYLEAKSQAPTP